MTFNKKGDPPLSLTEQRKLKRMRQANTLVTARYASGGADKSRHRKKPVTLAPMPWDRTAGDCK